jgi:hypothetical protein
MEPITAAILVGGSILANKMGSKSKSQTSKETQTTNNAPWSGLQPYLTGTGPVPSYLTRTPEVSDDWLARLQALGSGQLPSGGGSGSVQGATPTMIDKEKEAAAKAKEVPKEEEPKAAVGDRYTQEMLEWLEGRQRLQELQQMGVGQGSEVYGLDTPMNPWRQEMYYLQNARRPDPKNPRNPNQWNNAASPADNALASLYARFAGGQ